MPKRVVVSGFPNGQCLPVDLPSEDWTACINARLSTDAITVVTMAGSVAHGVGESGYRTVSVGIRMDSAHQGQIERGYCTHKVQVRCSQIVWRSGISLCFDPAHENGVITAVA